MLTLLSCSAVEHCCPAVLVPSKVVPMEGPLDLVCIEPHIILLSAIWDGRRWNNKLLRFRLQQRGGKWKFTGSSHLHFK